MIIFDEAQAILQAAVCAPSGLSLPPALGTEEVTIDAAAGRVLAAPIFARLDAPRSVLSAMDGYAVADATTKLGDRVRVIGESFAGAAFIGHVGVGEAVRIGTGAPVPQGANRVIMQENIDRDGDHAIIARAYSRSWHVRGVASDFAAGDSLLAAGILLTPQAMLAAAGADRKTLCVSKAPHIAIISTGDELAAPGTAYDKPHAIPETISYAVAALAKCYGAQVVSRLVVGDNLATLQATAGEALAQADVIITIGGASVGDRDFAKVMFAPHGLVLLFSTVAMKPGKPLWFGRIGLGGFAGGGNMGGKFILGLPGNPTSAMVTARLFLAPLLAGLQGQTTPNILQWRHLPLAPVTSATAEQIAIPSSARETFLRAHWGEEGLFPISDQNSAAQAALARADWLIRIAAGEGDSDSTTDRLVQALPF